MDIFPLNIVNNYNSLHGLPSFVKDAAVVTDEDVKTLPHTAFADAGRKLPMHSKAATWCSALTLRSGAVKEPTNTAALRLEKAAEYWGIGDECRTLAKNLEKDAEQRPLTDSDFALVAEHNGEKIRRYAVTRAENIKLSAERLQSERHQYPLGWRKSAAQNLIKHAHEMSVQLANEHQLQQMAGFGMAKASEIVPQLKLRAKLTKDAGIRSRFEKLAAEVQSMGDLDLEVLTKMAEAIDLADRAAGLYAFYGRGIDTPETFCHAHTLKEVSEKRAGLISLTNGQGVSKSALADVDADRFTALGSDFVQAIRGKNGKVDAEKAAELVPTLPLGDANLFVNSL